MREKIFYLFCPEYKRLSIIGSLCIVLLVNGACFGQDALTLNDCLRLAFENNNLLKVADLSIALADEKLAASKSQRLPTVNLSSMYTRIGKVTSFTIPMGPGGQERKLSFGTPNRVNLDVRLQLPVFTWGRISSTVALLQTGRALSDIQRKQQVMSVTDGVLRAFYAVLLNEKVIRLHEANVQRAESHLHVTEKRYASGHVPRLELLRAQVQLKNAESALEEARGNLVKSKIFLAKTIGRNEADISVTGVLAHESLTTNERELMARAWSLRSELNILRLQQELGKSQISLAKSGNKPNVLFLCSYNVMNGFDPMEPERFIDNWNVGVQLVVPLFDGFATSHQVQQAKIELRTAQLQERELRDVIRMQVRQALVSLKQAENKIAAQAENILLAREALQMAETQYQSGLTSSLEVIDAQQALSQSELMHTQAIFNHIMAKLDLCRAIGDYQWFEKSVAR